MKFDFEFLYNEVEAAIDAMDKQFNSHELILFLAQNNQEEYVRALYAYKDTQFPFMHVHKQLSGYIRKFEGKLVKCLGHRASTDIFGNSNSCLTWEKYT